MTLPKAALFFLHQYSLISASALCKLATVLFCPWNTGKLMEAERNLFPIIRKRGDRERILCPGSAQFQHFGYWLAPDLGKR